MENDLPQAESIKDISLVDPEVKPQRVRSLAVTVEKKSQSLIDCWNKFSSWTRLREVVALCLIYKRRILDKVSWTTKHPASSRTQS